MDVKLAVAWVDRAGVRHSAGDVVDVDPITLAELEEHQMVDPEQTTDGKGATAAPQDGYIGPGKAEKAEDGYIGPGKVDKDEQPTSQDGYIGPGKAE
ncbi:hypothetical protein J2S43_000398 [Catenuloplanes nepalensis]|uniref:Uncharacterized protein n=1 Tax=Catenuloplanes nepalensis TaxID=587533 RepID=A0ABT9MLF4_9ACTN|nr:hypothetical protein [Catenuloplanes nepalensis]MDP9791886.1 hypothetical protein [Catenuloplanes nepalensis]